MCTEHRSRRGAPVPPVGGCETERAVFADQSRRISRLRYTSPRHRPRFSMGIGERRGVPTLADTQHHTQLVRITDRGRDAAYGIRSVTNDIVRDCGFSCDDAVHVRYASVCDDESSVEDARRNPVENPGTTYEFQLTAIEESITIFYLFREGRRGRSCRNVRRTSGVL